ncbi:MAG TPA: trehalose-phosphatase [Burkholderiaceae bacterium]|nr:trehalose-phosphatase [Burkholderiaceae bacterium]
MSAVSERHEPVALLSPAGQAELERLARHATLYVFDFDGTLAPIVPRPDDAAMTPDMQAALDQLARRVPVAILTGRAVADIAPRVPDTVRYVVGNHGEEGLPGNAEHRETAMQTCRGWLAQLRAQWNVEQRWPGVHIEDKALSLTVHYRSVDNVVAVQEALNSLVQTLEPPPRIVAGKCVLNLLSPNGLTKRDALAQLAKQARCDYVLFVGDDVTDEHAFHNAPHTWTTVRVEPVGPTYARWFVSQQVDVFGLVRNLASLTEIRDVA